MAGNKTETRRGAIRTQFTEETFLSTVGVLFSEAKLKSIATMFLLLSEKLILYALTLQCCVFLFWNSMEANIRTVFHRARKDFLKQA